MKAIRIKPEILKLLTLDDFQTFTCPVLTEAYYQLPACTSPNKRAAGQLINRSIKLLEAQGFIQKVPHDTAKSPRYHLTALFQTHSTSPAIDKRNNGQFIDDLSKKLSDYKVELLSAIGEVEEYEALSQAMPEKVSQIQALYNSARDHYSKTLGRVKAIESLITQDQHL